MNAGETADKNGVNLIRFTPFFLVSCFIKLFKLLGVPISTFLLKIFDKIQHEGYYVKMAVAWAISMCYVKFPEKTRAFLEHNHLDTFTQNKAIQKIRESYRVSQEEKEELKKLKVPSRKEEKNEV